MTLVYSNQFYFLFHSKSFGGKAITLEELGALDPTTVQVRIFKWQREMKKSEFKLSEVKSSEVRSSEVM